MAVNVTEPETKYDVPEPVTLPHLDDLPQVAATSSASAGEVVLAYLRAQAGRLMSLDPMVRRDEPDSVHQMRVTTRRIRSTLRTFGHVLRRDRTERLAAELKWLGTVLGEARDAEVLGGHLQAMLSQTPGEQVMGPVLARIQGHFATAGGAARTALLAELGSRRYFSLLSELEGLLTQPPLTPLAARPARKVLPAAARRAYRRTAKQMRRAGHAPAGERRNAALHEARKAAKWARYAGEAMTPALGRQARRFTSQMKKVQSVLGDHHDSVIARRAARELGVSAHLDGETAFTYGLLYERGSCDAERLQARARHTWQRASRRRYRRWMS